MSFAIFVSDTASTFSTADSSTSASRLPCASKGCSGGRISRPVSRARRSRTRAANSGCVLSPVPVAVPPSGICATRGSASSMRCAAEPDLRRVAAELLAQRDRHGVHQVGATGLDDVRELVRLGLQRRLQPLERRQQLRAHLAQRRQVHRRREHVVGGLAHVDVVVRVHAALGEVGDHLVRVHVRRGARAGLEDVDRELVVVLARRDLVAGGRDALGDVGVEQARARRSPARRRP